MWAAGRGLGWVGAGSTEAETKADPTFCPSQNKPTPPWTSNPPHPQLPQAGLPGAKNKDTLQISKGNLCF